MQLVHRSLLKKLASWKDRDVFPGGGEDWDAPHVDDLCELADALSDLFFTPKFTDMVPLEKGTENQRQAFCLASFSGAVQGDGLGIGLLVNNRDHIPHIEAAAKKYGSKPLLALLAQIRETVPASLLASEGEELFEKLQEDEEFQESVERIIDSEEGEQARCEAMRLAAVIALNNPDEFFKPA